MALRFADRNLALRLEAVELYNQEQYYGTSRRYKPHEPVGYLKIDSGSALFAGLGSPVTQAFGLGLGETFDPECINELERFYHLYRSPVDIEVAQIADLRLFATLIERQYKLIEVSNVQATPLADDAAAREREQLAAAIPIRIIKADEVQMASRLIAAGFAEHNEANAASEIADVLECWFVLPHASCYLAEIEGELAGGGSLFINNGVAYLGGASVLPRFRGRGVQTALVAYRLQHALRQGCDVGMVVTQPMSVSHKTMERHHFQIVTSRTKFSLPFTG